MSYAEQAAEARRAAQIAQEEADVSTGFHRTALLDHANQLREKAERFDQYAAQQEASA